MALSMKEKASDPAHAYSLLGADETYRDDSSSDTQEPSIVEPPKHSRFRHWIIPALIGGAIAAFVTFLATNTLRAASRQGSDTIYKTMVPDFSPEIKRFTHSGIYLETGPEADMAWHSLAGPEGVGDKLSQQGFIQVDESLRYSSIEPGYMKNGKQKYGISMFHQLHCLAAIRTTVFKLLNGTLDTEAFIAEDKNVDDPEFYPSGHGLWHLKHCFDYVRQALQCAGDMSLEWPNNFNGKPLVVGWGIPHKCVNWETIWGWMVENA